MTHRNRLLSLAVAFPLWIVMILTGGQWCLMPESGGAHPVVSSAAGVGHGADGAHASHATGAHATGVQGAADDAPSAPAPHGAGGGACESQAACSVAIIPEALQLAVSVPALALRASAPVPQRPRSFAVAPELPPPRA